MTTPTTAGEIHVGDIGTVYRVPIYDDDLALANFDPSAATKSMVFSMPGAATALTRSAAAAQVTIDGVANVWCLTYTVLAADVVPGQFHQQAGPVSVQGVLVFSASQAWKSTVLTADHLGRPLQVVANL